MFSAPPPPEGAVAVAEEQLQRSERVPPLSRFSPPPLHSSCGGCSHRRLFGQVSTNHVTWGGGGVKEKMAAQQTRVMGNWIFFQLQSSTNDAETFWKVLCWFCEATDL